MAKEPTNRMDRVAEILSRIADVSDRDLDQQLGELCGGDEGLISEVKSLLIARGEQGGFMAAPTAEITGSMTVAESVGSRIGRYKLLQRIGEGGFGTVFMAEQSEPVRRRVAVKIIRVGMDSKHVIARFEAERQALAMMDHPNIARVLDAGTTESGRPYFVMELVKGEPITGFCEAQNLSTTDRLQLFRQVCLAVQHAHQRGIIHRDLKPSNILVTLIDGVPAPKVIDFGIAKAMNVRLTERTLFTEFQHMIGTPEYMSPEQAFSSGFDIDTRSDIYALGVLLYELLTGTRPLDPTRLAEAGLAEMVRVIKEEEPPLPSVRLSTAQNSGTSLGLTAPEPRKLSALVRGDLDWITMRCLEKDRNRRYETAKDVADDIRRHLDDEPIVAGPPGIGYRIGKFARRHRGRLVVGALAVLALLMAFGGVAFDLGRSELLYRAFVRQQNQILGIVDTKANVMTLEKLHAMELTLHGDETMSEFFAMIERKGIPVTVNWDAMQQAGASQTDVVGVAVTGMPVSDLLRILVPAEVASDVINGRVMIMSEEDLAGFVQTATYHVVDLLADDETTYGTRSEQLDVLAGLIRSTVDPTGWRSHGGQVSDLQRQNDQFIIKTTLANHREISGVLNAVLRGSGSGLSDVEEVTSLAAISASVGVDGFRESEETLKLLELLQSTEVQIDGPASRVDHALRQIGEALNVPLHVNWAALQGIGVRPDQEITFDGEIRTAAAMLSYIAGLVSKDPFTRANYAVRRGGIYVSSDQQLRENTILLTYDITELISEDTERYGQREEQIESILEVMQTYVDFDGWRDYGGETGIVWSYRDQFIVTNTWENHRQIVALFSAMIRGEQRGIGEFSEAAYADSRANWIAIEAYRFDPENERAFEVLSTERYAFGASSMEFGAVIDAIRREAGDVAVEVDWAALAEGDVYPESRVRVDIAPKTLRDHLNQALRDVTPRYSHVVWSVEGGAIVIASRAVLDRPRLVYSYNIADLIQPDSDTYGTRDEQVERIVRLIQVLVDLEGWVDFGGDTGIIHRFRDQLIINSAVRNHAEIAHVIAAMRYGGLSASGVTIKRQVAEAADRNGDAWMFHRVARFLLWHDDPGIQDSEMALELARRAAEAWKPDDLSEFSSRYEGALSLLAAAQHHAGRTGEAIETVKAILSHIPEGRRRESARTRYEKRLAEYSAALEQPVESNE